MTVDSTARQASSTTPAAGVPYFTPAQTVPAGSAKPQDKPVPTLFTPLQLRSLTLNNRFAVAPMCTYSADYGHLTDWHLVHYGAFALRGAALTIVEATSVLPNGRISPEDSGLWQDSQIAPLKRVVDFVHSQGQKIGIQLAHAGRKASCLAPWHAPGEGRLAGEEIGGWPDHVWAPSAIPYNDVYPQPKEMTVGQIHELVQAWGDAARRAVEAGVDTIEIHGAHGYMISEFLSPISNQRTDRYGGPFENRTRLLTEVIGSVRAAMPADMPLLLRISATEWMEHAGGESWDVEQSIRLAKLLPDLGVDLLDVSSGGNNPGQKIDLHPYYQVSIAGRIREALKADGSGKDPLLIGAVGLVTSAEMARGIVQENDGRVEIDEEHGQKTLADMVLVARQFLREPEFVLRTAAKLDVKVGWPLQFSRALWPKGANL